MSGDGIIQREGLSRRWGRDLNIAVRLHGQEARKNHRVGLDQDGNAGNFETPGSCARGFGKGKDGVVKAGGFPTQYEDFFVSLGVVSCTRRLVLKSKV